MEANNIFKRFQIIKNCQKRMSHKIKQNKKKCKITLWFEFEVHSKHLP